MTGRYPVRYGLQYDVIEPGERYGLSTEEKVHGWAVISKVYFLSFSDSCRYTCIRQLDTSLQRSSWALPRGLFIRLRLKLYTSTVEFDQGDVILRATENLSVAGYNG